MAERDCSTTAGKKAEHVVPWGSRNYGGARCTRCGEKLRIKLPLTVTTFVAVNEAFIEAHRECRPAKPRTARSSQE